ncbi:1840_t:CDS:2 [Dentiscutata erythropus]|uniref:1840_t:CDS:1 n=1 Tax=Dentiscutata erythropus TaxID=1348616 RepID=A0A9N9IUC6_9GLOM|nr:1840_t:CDS:2 [Dentiscutata erythropus]
MVKVIIHLHAIIVILILLQSSSTKLKQFMYEDPQAGLVLLDGDKSLDGTVILRFGTPVKQIGDTTCWDKTIYLRIIHPNASINLSISNHGIPDFNFCLDNETEFNYTTIWVFDQRLMLTFYNSSNIATSEIMGLFITFEGEVLRNENGEIIERARSGIIQTNIKVVTISAFYMLEKGFAIAYGPGVGF